MRALTVVVVGSLGPVGLVPVVGAAIFGTDQTVPVPVAYAHASFVGVLVFGGKALLAVQFVVWAQME